MNAYEHRPRPLLALGDFRRDERTALSVAATEAAFEADFVGSIQQAKGWIAEHEPRALIVEASSAQAEGLCVETRAQKRLAQVPIVSVSRELDDLSFAEVFSWGGDDAIEIADPRSLVTRLRSMPADLPALPDGTRGTALVADADRARRIVLGRVLRNAGYDIEFAASPDEVIRLSTEHWPSLVVASSELSEAPGDLLERARREGCAATWIVSCPPRRISAHRRAVEGMGNATVTDGYAPPENVVFLANELSRGGAGDKRASRRLLFGTTVAFRGAGRDRDDHGYSYNISEGGLYVRTLAPPEDDVVWLELTPPRSERRVRLEGQVVWRRPFGPSGQATVPPGFGVKITDGARVELDAWRDGYRAFSATLGFDTAA